MLTSGAGGASLLAGDPDALDAAAAALQRAGLSIGVVGESVSDHSFEVTANWSRPTSAAAHTAMTKLGNGIQIGSEVAVAAADKIRTYAEALRAAKARYDGAKAQIDVLRRDFLTGIDDASPEDAAASRDLFTRHSHNHFEDMSGAVTGLASASAAAAAEIDAFTGQLEGMTPDAQPGAGGSGFDRFMNETGNQLDGTIDGFFGTLAEPVVLVGGLVGLGGDASDNWSDLGHGIAYSATPKHWGETFLGVIGWDDLSNGDLGHWFGSLGAGAFTAVLTGGGAVALRGTKALPSHSPVEPGKPGGNPLLDKVEEPLPAPYGRPQPDAPASMNPGAHPPAALHSSQRDLPGADQALKNPWGVDRDTGKPFTEQEFTQRFIENTGWPRYPLNAGAVPLSKIGFTDMADYTAIYGNHLDRIGSPGGDYLGGPAGQSFESRALPPDKLGAELIKYDFSGKLPQRWTVEVSEVAEAFGREGGGTQVRVLNGDGAAVSVQQLIDRKILKP